MHISVLKKEAIEKLSPKSNENFIDGTLGGAGHTKAILEKTEPEGKVLGIDWDKTNIDNLKEDPEVLKNRLVLANGNFANLKNIIREKGFDNISGIILDLGMSSLHLDESKRGFSFKGREELDMRYSQENQVTARKIVNTFSEKELERIFREYGEERFSRQIAGKIIDARAIKEITDTEMLVKIIEAALPQKSNHKISPATRVFQALRIAVNRELENLKEALSQSIEILNPGGRLVVISFHSLEDRIVKIFFKEEKGKGKAEIITKKPITPSKEEIKFNPRSRSAKLRAIIKK